LIWINALGGNGEVDPGDRPDRSRLANPVPQAPRASGPRRFDEQLVVRQGWRARMSGRSCTRTGSCR